jgi:hydroxymethylbilane synthase
MQNTYIIGTRGSLLAVTQCTLIKNEISNKTGAGFELVKIKTQGDQITDKPLWQLEGKDFFTKELDTALLKNEIDMVVHSYKDLGSERPEDIELACITERKFAHDILLIKKSRIKELHTLNKLVIGTSSPRRIYNIEKKLSQFIPGKTLPVECKMLRGNVNTRIEKLLNNDYDGIVLALAGLERLASSPESKVILEGLLRDLNFMVLPQKIFPASASQGALAIEINKNRTDQLPTILRSVHHQKSADEISRERKSFNSYGGGCHLAVGIHVKKVHDYYVHIHHGHLDDKSIDKLELEGFDYSSISGQSAYFIYGENDFLIEKPQIKNLSNEDENLFVTSSNCLHNIKKFNSLWAGGNRSLLKLVESGYWVNGSAEGFGHEEVYNIKNSHAIKILLGESKWKVLSHDKAKSEVGEVVPSYTHKIVNNFPPEKKEKLLGSDIIFWSSYIQYNAYTEKFPELKLKKHACGLGKTYTAFKDAQINVIPCIDMKHLRELL